jgi:hypothetical protein
MSDNLNDANTGMPAPAAEDISGGETDCTRSTSMINMEELIKVFGEKLAKTGSFDAAFTKAMWVAYQAGGSGTAPDQGAEKVLEVLREDYRRELAHGRELEQERDTLREQVRVLAESASANISMLHHAKAAFNTLHNTQPDNPEGDHYARHYSHLWQSCQRVIDESSEVLAAVKGGQA